MKYTYKLYVNEGAERNKYHFPYGSTDDATLAIAKGKALIEVSLTKNYSLDFEGSYAESLFKEGLKRANLVHLMLYSEPLKINVLRLLLLQGTQIISDRAMDNFPVLFPLVERIAKLPDCWKNKEIIAEVLSKKKTCQGSETAALYAYITSKSKKYETEKFIFQWMAFNGMYTHIADPGIDNERAEIGSLLRRYGYGHSICTKKERAQLGKKVVRFISGIDDLNISKESLENGKHLDLADKIAQLLPEISCQATPYGYLLGDFSYYLRCEVIHSDKPLQLFSFADDGELKAITVANRILEEFLDENLCDCFSAL